MFSNQHNGFIEFVDIEEGDQLAQKGAISLRDGYSDMAFFLTKNPGRSLPTITIKAMSRNGKKCCSLTAYKVLELQKAEGGEKDVSTGGLWICSKVFSKSTEPLKNCERFSSRRDISTWGLDFWSSVETRLAPRITKTILLARFFAAVFVLKFPTNWIERLESYGPNTNPFSFPMKYCNIMNLSRTG